MSKGAEWFGEDLSIRSSYYQDRPNELLMYVEGDARRHRRYYGFDQEVVGTNKALDRELIAPLAGGDE
jgi:hypothetical protein